MNEESVGRIVEMRTVQGAYHGVGKVLGYQGNPTYTILTPAGKRVSWMADLCIEPGLSREATEELFAQVQRLDGK